ncbi:acetyl-CoA C-acetyltransferase [Roseivirga ehrenbergii]|uniref:Beta-ketoadipyl CoA thiolase n=1 Tax=Roseivirga ehrenbergii (strain DSM 102268 / JCM 13514 / KCTC 12282 / NCIMB 14502 / KMM 6017) TaxID=279360 RepID=A0A150XTK8_ROSEK|nr:acetyl-CoA C-acyltransferase [Roseivirga ehrenbergii]KYG82053.1 beta-ketoadipyl CoA thiolase [Roseivirga ehrenbergii]TCL01875.1 acetyl-CoA C-acetyltransferase [Roseivirga ehrenbergii]
METAYIVDIVRTPVGKFGGTLASVRPDDLAAHVIKALMARNPSFDPKFVEDVIFGAANQAGEDNRNVARMALLLAGLPIETGGVTVNRLCASGLQSIMDASRALMLGEAGAYIAGGVESMTRAPFVLGKSETAFGRATEMYDTTIGWRFINPKLSELHYPYGMGETAENVAEKWKVSREAQDEFAHHTQLKYQAAHEAGKFKNELAPVEIPQRKGDAIIFDKDEHPRLSSVEKLSTLAPAFRKGGSVTAGNSSGINDGAAASLIVNEATLKQFNLQPMARVVSMAIAGVSPDCMGVGPIPATQKALKRAGLTANDIDLAEVNEAFAAQAIPCVQELGLNPDIVNVNGGSIAIGHPLGGSGTRISATLLHEMQKRENVKYGLATMCIGVGQGAAIIYEKL